MEGLQGFRRVVNRVTHGLAYGGMFVLLPLMLLTSADVLGRAFWNKPVPGTVELSSFILVVFILCGLAYTHQVKGHVRVTMLLDRLPRPVALGMDLLTTLMSMLVLLVITWQGWEIAWDQNTVSDMLRVPQRPFRILVTVAGVCFFLELLLDLLATLGKLRGGRETTRA
ncbi:MAG: TRAP transporter small permease [Desulfarculus sp.]|nr:TRAP transporter small permease [Desulfarculus sp.]